MAKKAKEYFVHLDLELDINVSKDQVDKFCSDIERREFALSVDIKYGDGMSSPFNIYPDMLRSGEMTLVRIKDQKFRVSCKGVAARKFDLPFENDLLACLEQGDLVAVPSGVINSDAEGVDLDVKDKSLHGRCSLKS